MPELLHERVRRFIAEVGVVDHLVAERCGGRPRRARERVNLLEADLLDRARRVRAPDECGDALPWQPKYLDVATVDPSAEPKRAAPERRCPAGSLEPAKKGGPNDRRNALPCSLSAEG